jgi:hypothetical protein
LKKSCSGLVGIESGRDRFLVWVLNKKKERKEQNKGQEEQPIGAQSIAGPPHLLSGSPADRAHDPRLVRSSRHAEHHRDPLRVARRGVVDGNSGLAQKNPIFEVFKPSKP